jgi:orotidine-5'-phosphate decarboxylase
MSSFADRLQSSIDTTGSALVAGCDPVLDNLPTVLLAEAERVARTDGEYIERALSLFAELFITAVSGRVAAVKPNIAFFEQYGLPGLSVFQTLCERVRAAKIPLIIDAKRGDIGSTAAAYSAAFVGHASVRGRSFTPFECDALTINPFLGFDTIEPFLVDCERREKGLFVLLQTSNPGAKDIQGLRCGEDTVSGHIARWLAAHGPRLLGECGWSGLGAVVGASYPEEARDLRQKLPQTFFLMPGFGAQGAGADDAIAGFGTLKGRRGGALVNVSRGLVAGEAKSLEGFGRLIAHNADRFNSQLRKAIS